MDTVEELNGTYFYKGYTFVRAMVIYPNQVSHNLI